MPVRATGEDVLASVTHSFVAMRTARFVAGVDRMLTLVDDALYEAKRAGRDRVVVAPRSDGQSRPADGGAATPIDIARVRRERQNRRS